MEIWTIITVAPNERLKKAHIYILMPPQMEDRMQTYRH